MSTIKLHHPASQLVLADVKRASRHIASYAHRTPVLTCQSLDQMAGHQLFFKCENLQRAGAFKFRGAINALSHLSAMELARGVVTHSSGNHAGALALAAKIFKTRAYVVMPSSASDTKRNAVLEYGGEVITSLPNAAAREATARQVQSDTGAVMIPPFDHPDIIAGQGTVALEMLQQVPHLEYIIAPVGGGGMVAGICIAAKAISPRIRVLAAEPAGADDAFQSFKANRFIPQTNPMTIADGLLTSLGEITWPIIQKNVQAIVTVTDEEIIHWMRVFWERTKLLIEPSSAVAVAAVFSSNFPRTDSPKNVGIVLSGGNVNLNSLPWN